MYSTKISKVIKLAEEHNISVIPEGFSKQIIEYIGGNIPRQGLASSEEEAAHIAETIGFPVVLKVHSFDIVHKSDAKGVLVGLGSPEEVKEGYRKIIKNARAYLETNTKVQVSVQQMAGPGTEVIIGMKRDEVFGPTILFGLGGVWVEVLKDISLRVSPLTENDVDEMINEIQGRELLGNFRGNEERDLTALKDLIFKIEKLALDHPQISEIDLNPVFVYEKGKGVVVVDARVVIQKETVVQQGGIPNE